ncbi:Competence protein CoiA-like family protein [Ferrimonas sediminum]|uniref:Competence protein CoiA-like family protein n=1 Tax=Ferrimonas sediminum TaxID=718193 RepID=A0A1G8YB62_9GAMM|nr:competence protein CoiA family protein [Ferrimonas sediminum]SDJ99961.1 Competence protein CoiA-like family protein [Ferrimonas sediminum]
MTPQIQMTVALDRNGQITSINDVQSGLACGCICPSCGEPLIARRGDKNAHHFAHQGIESHCDAWGPETELHLRAKAYLLSQQFITLPSCNFDKKPFKLPISKAIQEKQLSPTGRIPDLLLEIDHELLAIEIAVTHSTTKQKRATYRKHSITAIEFTLSDFKNYDTPFDDAFFAKALDINRASWLTVDLFSSLGLEIFKNETKSRRRQIEILDQGLSESEKQVSKRLRSINTEIKKASSELHNLRMIFEHELNGAAGAAMKEYEARKAEQEARIDKALSLKTKELNRLTRDIEIARQWESELSAVNEKLREENRKLKKEKKALLAD